MKLIIFLCLYSIALGKESIEIGDFCDKTLTSSNEKSGELVSPLYPDLYPPTYCVYELIGERNEKVQVIFNEFDLFQSTDTPESDTNCGDDDSTLSYIRYGEEIKLCGKKIPLPIMSEGSHLKLIFRAFKRPHDAKGFNATYRFITNYGIESGEQQQSYCRFAYDSQDETKRSGVVHSPNFPGYYPKDLRCEYIFYGQEYETLHINFMDFSLRNDVNCNSDGNDYVILTAEVNDPTNQKVLCGAQQEPLERIVTNATYYRLTFISKSDIHKEGMSREVVGFRANYEFVNSTQDTSTATTYKDDTCLCTVVIFLTTTAIWYATIIH